MRRLILLGLTVLLAVGACGSDDESTGSPSGATSTVLPASGAAWNLIVISDSALGDGTNTGTNRAVPEAFARAIRSDIGVEVEIESFFYGGATSQRVLEEIRGNDAMRSALGSADVVLLWVPYGELKTLCPWNASAYRPGPGTGEEYQACGAATAESLGADSDAILSELTSLRGPRDALIRVLNYWVPFVPTFEEMGVASVARANFDRFNEGLAAAAARHGLPVADVHAALMGPEGAGDPVADGFVQTADEIHLTDTGVTEVVQVLRDLGYEHR